VGHDAADGQCLLQPGDERDRVSRRDPAAAVLQRAADDAVNYGGIGAVIGHEISHGFDDQGSQYDADGNLRDWFTRTIMQKFAAKTKALVAQYDAYEPVPGFTSTAS
jgi:predicted metalloendopeptidase